MRQKSMEWSQGPGRLTFLILISFGLQIGTYRYITLSHSIFQPHLDHAVSLSLSPSHVLGPPGDSLRTGETETTSLLPWPRGVGDVVIFPRSEPNRDNPAMSLLFGERLRD